jgi:hypothetical protein
MLRFAPQTRLRSSPHCSGASCGGSFCKEIYQCGVCVAAPTAQEPPTESRSDKEIYQCGGLPCKPVCSGASCGGSFCKEIYQCGVCVAAPTANKRQVYRARRSRSRIQGILPGTEKYGSLPKSGVRSLYRRKQPYPRGEEAERKLLGGLALMFWIFSYYSKNRPA